MLTHELLAAGAQKPTKDERDDQDIVELTGDGDEVGNEVEWEREVADKRGQEHLSAPGHPLVGQQARYEDDAVGDEAGECASVLAPSGRH